MRREPMLSWLSVRDAMRRLDLVAFAALGLQCPLVGHVLGVPVNHRPRLPSVEPHQVPLGPAGLQPRVAEGVPELVGRYSRVPRLLGPPDQHLPDPRAQKPSPPPRP